MRENECERERVRWKLERMRNTERERMIEVEREIEKENEK